MRCFSGTKCYVEEYITKSRNGFRPTRVPPLFVVRELPPSLLFDYEPRRSHSRRRHSLVSPHAIRSAFEAKISCLARGPGREDHWTLFQAVINGR